MGNEPFISYGKEIKKLRGGAPRYTAQASLRIDAATAGKGRSRMKTRLAPKAVKHNFFQLRGRRAAWLRIAKTSCLEQSLLIFYGLFQTIRIIT
jgi:hypothetical protein